MASLRCHGDSDCNKMATPIAIKLKKYTSLYNAVVVTFFPYLNSCRRSYCSNLGGIPPKKSS